MAVGSELQAHSLRERAGAWWATLAKTVIGDIVATAVALAGVSLLFLGCAFALLELARAAEAVLRYLG